MSFGKCTWDQWKVVESYIDHGNEMTEKLNEFMKRQAEIESEYSKSLQKLVKQHKDEINRKASDRNASSYIFAVQKGSIFESWMYVLDQVDNIAINHQNVSEKLETSLRKSIKYRAKDNEKLKKQRFDDIRKNILDLSKALDLVDKEKIRYEKAARDIENAKLASEAMSKNANASRKEIDRVQSDYEKKAVIAYEQIIGLKSAIADANLKKNVYFEEYLPSQLDLIQKDDEELRIKFLKESLLKYHDILSTPLPEITTAIESMSPVFQSINPFLDSECLCNEISSTDKYPSDYEIFEFSEVDQDRRKILQGVAKMKDFDKYATFDIDTSALVTKEHRKKAVEKVKQYEKEIAEMEKRKSGLQMIGLHFKEKPELYHMADVNNVLSEQYTSIDEKTSTLQLKKHKILTFIANFDGTIPPELPESLKHKTFDSPISPTGIFTNPSSPDISGNDEKFCSLTIKEDEKYSSAQIELNEEEVVDSDICMIKMIYSFEASPDSEEISVEEGDELQVIEKLEDGWWRANMIDPKTGIVKEGLVPSNYCEIIE